METERQNICLAKNVGTYLKHKLRSTQMTHAQFAERMGVEERTVIRWVSGDIHKIEIIEDIACMFQDDITSVVTFEEDDDVFDCLLTYVKPGSGVPPEHVFRNNVCGIFLKLYKRVNRSIKKFTQYYEIIYAGYGKSIYPFVNNLRGNISAGGNISYA